MSGISVDRFVSVARESGTGEVRFARGSGGEGEGSALVNKGTFGQRVATAFSRDSGTVPQRQAAAIASFRDALSREYGASLADKAMAGARITQGQAMTGAQILDAVARAKADKAQNSLDCHWYCREYRARGFDQNNRGCGPGFEHFRDSGVILGNFNKRVALAFNEGFKKDLAEASEGGRKWLSPVEAEIIAHRRMCTVLERNEPGSAERAKSRYPFRYQEEGAGAGAGAARMEGPVVRPEVMVPRAEGEGEAPRAEGAPPPAEGAPPPAEGAPPRPEGEPIRA